MSDNNRCKVINNNFSQCAVKSYKKSCFCKKHRTCTALTNKGKKCRSIAGINRLCTKHSNLGKVNTLLFGSKEYNNLVSCVNKIKSRFRHIIHKRTQKVLKLWKNQHKEYRMNFLKYFINNKCAIPQFYCAICFRSHRKRMPGCIDNEITFSCNYHSICRSCAIQMAYKCLNFCPICRKTANVDIEFANISRDEKEYAMLTINRIISPFLKKRIYVNNGVKLSENDKPTYVWKYGSDIVNTVIGTQNVLCYAYTVSNSICEHDFLNNEDTKRRFTEMYMNGCFEYFKEGDNEFYGRIFIREIPDTSKIICAIIDDVDDIKATNEEIEIFRILFGTDAFLIESDYSPILVNKDDEEDLFDCYSTCMFSPLSRSVEDLYLGKLDNIDIDFNINDIPHNCTIRDDNNYIILRTSVVSDLQYVLSLIVNINRYSNLLPEYVETYWSDYEQTFFMKNPSSSDCEILNETTKNTEIKWVTTLPTE
jgi:hypothetical protein